MKKITDSEKAMMDVAFLFGQVRGHFRGRVMNIGELPKDMQTMLYRQAIEAAELNREKKG